MHKHFIWTYFLITPSLCFGMDTPPVVTTNAALPTHSVRQPGNLRDESTYACVNAYYGIGQAVDYDKAYKCFDSNVIYEYLIPMQLNGEGVPASADKAKKLMNDWLSVDPDIAGSDDAIKMEQFIDGRSSNSSKANSKVDFCRDIASSNYDFGFCIWIQDQLDKQGLERSLVPIRAKLRGNELSLWDNLFKVFDSYLDAEGERGTQLYAGGSSAGQAYTLQQTFVRQNFYGAIKTIFGDMKLIPSSKKDLLSAEADMQKAYDANIADYEVRYAPPAETSTETSDDKEFRETETSYIAQYKADIVASQSKWLMLRDAFAKLAVAVYQDKPNADWETSAKRALTIVRMGDLRHRPLGDD